MRCWQRGQRGSKASFRRNFDAIKVTTMLEVNRAKYKAHADLRADLLATGDAEIKGGPSTCWRFRGKDHKWQYWNGRIQMLIREELKAPEQRTPGVLEELMADFEAYAGVPLLAVCKETSEASAAAEADANDDDEPEVASEHNAQNATTVSLAAASQTPPGSSSGGGGSSEGGGGTSEVEPGR
mmetsp:Transcript_35210/g.60782  ORF Transcript_35210/g.60782 Transcript_35210/m.60782 type:complete len:183 (+) Transcript_35210:178-726(+)